MKTRLARVLLLHETGGSQEPALLLKAMERVCEKLRTHLVVLMGLDGFTLLLIRSFTLVVAEFPWMENLPAKKDGSLACIHANMNKQSPPELLAGFNAVISALLGQLVAFIGEPLTLRLLQDIWPELMLSNHGLVEEEMN